MLSLLQLAPHSPPQIHHPSTPTAALSSLAEVPAATTTALSSLLLLISGILSRSLVASSLDCRGASLAATSRDSQLVDASACCDPSTHTFVFLGDSVLLLVEEVGGLDLFFAMALDTEAPPGSSLVVPAVGLAVVSVGGSRLSHIKGAILRGTQSSVSDNIHEIGILSQLGSTKLC